MLEMREGGVNRYCEKLAEQDVGFDGAANGAIILECAICSDVKSNLSAAGQG